MRRVDVVRRDVDDGSPLGSSVDVFVSSEVFLGVFDVDDYDETAKSASLLDKYREEQGRRTIFDPFRERSGTLRHELVHPLERLIVLEESTDGDLVQELANFGEIVSLNRRNDLLDHAKDIGCAVVARKRSVYPVF